MIPFQYVQPSNSLAEEIEYFVCTPIRGVYEKYATIFRMKDDIYVVDYSETDQVFYTTDYTKVRNNLEQNYGEWFERYLLNRLTRKPVQRLSQWLWNIIGHFIEFLCKNFFFTPSDIFHSIWKHIRQHIRLHIQVIHKNRLGKSQRKCNSISDL